MGGSVQAAVLFVCPVCTLCEKKKNARSLFSCLWK
jgi:hypothetical protein